jgi:hypothetical protein
LSRDSAVAGMRNASREPDAKQYRAKIGVYVAIIATYAHRNCN